MKTLCERESYRALAQRYRPLVVAHLVQELGSARAAARRTQVPPAPPIDCAWCCPADPDYPAQLNQLHDPPPVLYWRGSRALDAESRCVAIVGTRRPTAYGLNVAARLGRELAEAGVTVISGLARGIDGAAHQGSLEVGEATCVGVLGCGLDLNYPPEHARLRRRLESRGVIFSEYPGQKPALPHHFPARNRIVAALAEIVVVIEAPLGSGALITANQALELSREVMVVPGPIGTRHSEGSHGLVREGASIVRDSADILAALAVKRAFSWTRPVESESTSALLDAIPGEGCRADQLALGLSLPVAEVMAWLTVWELQGKVRRSPQGCYLKA